MSLLYPIPRGTREVSIATAPGQTQFGPLDFLLYDAADLTAWVKLPGADYFGQVDGSDVTVTPAAPATTWPAFPMVTLATAQPDGSTLTLRGVRVPERASDVTRNGTLQSQSLERELDKQVATEQELRRDIDRSSANADRVESIAAHVDIVAVDVEADRLATEAARDIAVEAAASGRVNFSSRAALIAAMAAPVLLYAVLAGYAQPGDAPPTTYTRVTAPGVVKPWHVQSADGAWWQMTEREVAPEHFGAKGDFDVTNDVVAAQAAIDYAIAFDVPLVVARTYYCSGDLYAYKPNGSIAVRGNGHFSGFRFAGSTSLRFTGSATALPNLSISVVKDDAQVSFVASVAATLAPDDKFFIWDSTPASWLSNRDAYCKGEIFQVAKVDNNTAYIYGFAMDGYTGAGVKLYKLNPVQAALSDFRVSTTGEPGTLCQVDLSSGGRISNVRVDGRRYTGLSIRRSYDGQITGVTTNNAGYPTDSAYAFSIANCQNVKVFGTGSASTRQSLLIGGYGSTDATAEAPSLNIVNRFVTVHGMHLQNTNNDAGDMHGNCEFCEYVSCTFWGGAALGGQNNKWVDCVLYPIRDTGITSGYCANGSEIRGGTFEFINCKFLFGNGDLAAQGAINITNNYQNSQVLDLYVDVVNCEFSGAGSANGYPVQVISSLGANLKYVSVRVLDPVLKINNMGAVLYVSTTDLTTPVPSNYLIVDNPIYTGAGNPYFIYPSTAIAACPRRESRQTGFIDVTTAASVIAVAGPQSFKFKYSKLPTATAGVSKPDGSTASYYGGQMVSSIVYGLSTSTIRPAIVSAANMTASDTARLHWSAEVRDV